MEGGSVGDRLLYRITGADGQVTEDSDPVGAATEEPPSICSRIADLAHEWNDDEWNDDEWNDDEWNDDEWNDDDEWMSSHGCRIAVEAPVSIDEAISVRGGAASPRSSPK